MASVGSTVRKDLHDLTKPMEVRELNRQLEWVWRKILGGLTDKDISADGITRIITKVEKQIIDEIDAGTIETSELKAAFSRLMVAEIGIANIDFAKIIDLATGDLIFEQGTGGELFCEKLQVTDANIVEVSANKLTAGTIDAAEIEVVNLRAANITVGTINGQQIAQGAVDVGHIKDGAVTGPKIDFGAVSANKLDIPQHFIY
jgi:hypothetical protein